MESRDYQERAARRLEWLMRMGRKPLCVCPTGGGKTEIGTLVMRRHAGRIGFVVHTTDLVEQTAERLRGKHGLDVGIVAAGFPPSPFAQIQVVSIQTLVAREVELRLSMLVLDEAHHYLADEWRAAIEQCGARYMMGLTATPERGDGQPLGDIFDELVVAASYSELIHRGYLVPLRVYRPSSELDRGVAKKLLAAYLDKGEGRHGFAFVRSVAEAESTALEFCGAAVPSSVVEAKTPKEERRARISRLGLDLRLLFNVRALTEGVDVPSASVAVVGRNFMHRGGMIQATGRVLRAAPGKTDAILLDLPGVTHRLRVPTEDWEYSLEGQGIRAPKAEALHVCMMCGCTFPSGGPCPRCGHREPVKAQKPLRIYDKELEAVYDGKSTPEWAKRAELDRLRIVARNKGLNLYWVRNEYERLFGEKPVLGGGVGDENRAEFDRLVEQAKQKGYSKGWAQHRYRATFGAFPPKAWVPA